MCTYVIFPGTAVGPVIGNSIDDAMEYSLAPGFAERSHVGTQCPENRIVALGVGGASCEYEMESEEIFPYNPPIDRCASLTEIEDLLIRYAHFPKRANHIGLLDLRSGQTLGIERSLNDVDTWRSEDGIIYDTYGGCRSPKLRRLCNQDSALFRYWQRRMDSIEAAIERNRDNLGVEAMWETLLNHAPRGAVCQHADSRPKGVFLVTLSVSVLAPAIGRLWTRWLKDGRPPCQGEPDLVEFEPWPCG